MSNRTLVVLGTASQAPTKYRNHNGYFLHWQTHRTEPHNFLFDPGEGTQRQMLFCDVSPASINKIFITHLHGDHCLGLPGVIQAIANATKEQDFKKKVEIYYPEVSEKYIHNLINSCVYKVTANIVLCPVSRDGIVYEDSELTIEARRLIHRTPTFGYKVIEKDSRRMLPDKLVAHGIVRQDIGKLNRDGKLLLAGKEYLLEDFSIFKKGQTFSFVMDSVVCDAAFRLAEGSDLFVCESTYLSSEEAEAKQNGHMTAHQAAMIAKESNVKRLLLTHFSQRYPITADFENEAKLVFDESIAAIDRAIIKID